MDINKVLFVAQEIAPYLEANAHSRYGRDLPTGIQEHGAEVRTFMPKYGIINERRNQLHEVIRLSGMNVIIDDTDHPLIIKVATMQPSRMQVYFIYNEDYFMPGLAQTIETESSPEDNDERSIFFVRGVLETVRKLRWNPDIIHCNGWITALMPLYIKANYNDDPSFRDARIVYSLLDDEFAQPFDAGLAEKLRFDGLPAEVCDALSGRQADYLALTRLAIEHCDAITQASADIKPEVLELVKASGKPFLPYVGDENPADAYYEFYRSL